MMSGYESAILGELEQPPDTAPHEALCKIEPLEQTVTMIKNKPHLDMCELPNINEETFPQLEQQVFQPEEKPSVSSYDNDELKCMICGAQYQHNKASYYEAHMAQHTCPVCKKAVPLTDMVMHVKLHLVNRSKTEGKLDLPCKLCWRRFRTMVSYDMHMNQVHRCPVCDQCFKKKEVLAHIKTHFGVDGSIKLDKASVVAAKVEQRGGDADSDDSSSRPGEKRKRQEDDSEESEPEENDTLMKAKLVVKIQKALKRSVKATSPKCEDDEDDDEEDDEEDEQDLDIKDNKKKEDEDDEGRGGREKNRERENDKNDDGYNESNDYCSDDGNCSDGDNCTDDCNNDGGERKVHTSKKNRVHQDEEGDLSVLHLEELEPGHDNNIDDSGLFEEVEEDGTTIGKPSIKQGRIARARYIRELADRMSTKVDDTKCTMCPVVCQFPNRIRKHVRKVHYCQFCDEFFSREDLPHHLKVHDAPDKKHTCQFCAVECLTAAKLHYHECTFKQKADLYYHCKICKGRFGMRDSLIMHLRTHDPSDFPSDSEKNTCQLCGFLFLGRPNLVRHMQSRTCTQCGLKTVSSCQHQKHVLSCHHSAYQCPTCDVQFLSQHSYIDHVTERQCSGCHDAIEPSCEYLKHETSCKTGRERDTPHPEFLCLKCDAILTDTYVYDCHVRDHNRFPGKYQCKLCGEQFSQNHDYGLHMSKRTCPQCLGKFQPMCAWSKHTCYRVDQPSVSCPHCEKVFLKVSLYRKHCKILHCSLCPQLVFSSVCSFREHHESMHGGEQAVEACTKAIKEEKISDVDDCEEEVEEEDDGTPKRRYSRYPPNPLKLANKSCEHCDEYQMPISQSKLRRHLVGATCQICKEVIAPFCLYTSHYIQCAYNLAPTDENKALLTNDGTQPVHCPLCRMKLNKMAGLKSHLRMSDHVCKECGETFPALCVFRLHQLKTQHGRREHVCPICSKGFHYSRDLKKHILIHTGERPYDCLLCGNSYRNPGHLSYHLKVQHGGARPYKCKYCGRGFGAQSGCRKHEKRHEKQSQYKCEHCGMMFVAAHSLTKHLSTKVCLEADKNMPTMLPNMLDEHDPLQLCVEHEIPSDSADNEIANSPLQPESDPDYTTNSLPKSNSLKRKRRRKKPKAKTSVLIQDAEITKTSLLLEDSHNNKNSLLSEDADTKASGEMTKMSVLLTKDMELRNCSTDTSSELSPMDTAAVVKEEPLSE